jgi:hypothetical protein
MSKTDGARGLSPRRNTKPFLKETIGIRAGRSVDLV